MSGICRTVARLRHARRYTYSCRATCKDVSRSFHFCLCDVYRIYLVTSRATTSTTRLGVRAARPAAGRCALALCAACDARITVRQRERDRERFIQSCSDSEDRDLGDSENMPGAMKNDNKIKRGNARTSIQTNNNKHSNSSTRRGPQDHARPHSTHAYFIERASHRANLTARISPGRVAMHVAYGCTTLVRLYWCF